MHAAFDPSPGHGTDFDNGLGAHSDCQRVREPYCPGRRLGPDQLAPGLREFRKKRASCHLVARLGRDALFSALHRRRCRLYLPIALLEYRDRAHFLLVDKPGIPFATQLKFDEKRGRPIEIDNAAYRAGLTKSHLTARAAIAIREARKLLGFRMSELIIIGGSEGAQYAFALAREVQADQVVGWGGIALPQYYDLIIEQRLAAERGEITRAEAQANVEQIYRQIKAIGKAPYDLSERFQGEAYRRRSGFGPYAAVDDMLALDVPLLLVQGGRDSSAPILNSDYAMLAFLMRGKANLEYWVYPNSDHSFNSTDPANKSKTISIQKEVWDRVWEWIEQR